MFFLYPKIRLILNITDALFAILEVGARRKPKSSWVTDIKIIDQRFESYYSHIHNYKFWL